MLPDSATDGASGYPPQTSAPRALIIGCGYLGAVAARRLADARREVWATTRTRDRWERLGAWCARLVQYDIASAGGADALPRRNDLGTCDVFVMLTPSAITPAIANGGYRRLLEAVVALNPRRAVLVSSTGVYGEQAGRCVTAETPPRPISPRGTQLLEIENQWLAAGPQQRVCRLAGIYGPGRVIGRAALTGGEVLPGDPVAWLNLIHVEDAAELIIRCTSSDSAHAVELGSDGEPVTRETYYAYLATLLGTRPPQFDRDRHARSGSKRCDPGSTLRRLDWAPTYQDFRAGLAASLENNAAGS